MDNYKLLYKEQRFYTLSQRSRLNRELIAARRIEQRRCGYQESRNISSPIRNKKESKVAINCSEDKENVTNITTDENTNTTRLVKIISNATNPEILTKQESYVKRFFEWKEKNSMKKEINKKKPFLSAVGNKTQTSTYNFVPSGHEGFRPPEGLKTPVDQKDEKAKPAVVKGRQSIYFLVPTPPRSVEKCANKFLIAKKVVATSSFNPATANKSKTKTQAVCKEQSIIKGTTKSTAKSAASTLENNKNTNKTETFAPTANKSKTKTQAVCKKQTKIKTTTKSTAKSAASTSENNKKANKTENFAQPAVTSTNRQAGAVAKVRKVAQKRAETDKPNKNSQLKKSGAALAQNLKAKKSNTIKNRNAPSLQINGKRLNNLINYNKLDDDMVIKTPKDFFTLNPFQELVTSTRIKSSTDDSKNVEKISPKETSCERFHSNSSSRRNIFLETNTTLRKECDYKPQEKTKEDDISKKFNFIRYSNATDVTDIDQKDKREKQGGGEEQINNLSDNNGNKTVQVIEATETTPVKSGPEERPVNYLSPYVSVARGKVSLKKEEQNAAESIDVPTSTKYSVEVRRTNEKVRTRKFNFLFNEDGTPFNDENREDANQTHEEDLSKSCGEEPESTDASQRTLTLRNRRVRLRPSCEIVIPKK